MIGASSNFALNRLSFLVIFALRCPLGPLGPLGQIARTE
jgi:hypothetical protein